MLRRLAQLRPAWLLALIVVVSSGATLLAMRRTSTTFDEIVLMAAGARGYTTGKWDLAPEHPPLTQYLYGLPVYLTRPHYPQEPTTGWISGGLVTGTVILSLPGISALRAGQHLANVSHPVRGPKRLTQGGLS